MNIKKNKITWLASYPKSGNTWLRSLITAYLNNGDLNINNIMALNDKMAPYYQGIIGQPICDWTMLEQALVKPAALLKMLHESEANLMLKTHDCNVQMANVAQIPTELTLSSIYIVRDPRDIALSIRNHYGCKDNAEAVSRLLDDSFITRGKNDGLFFPQLSWKLHIKSWVRDLPYPTLVLKYEDLLTDPFKEFSRVVKFLKFDYDEARTLKAIEACTFDKMQQQEAEQGFKEAHSEQFFYKGIAQRWKTDLEIDLQDRIIEVLRAEMELFHYI